MTDKRIIIDGVDVSYCPNHYNGWSALHRDHRPMCECGYDRECKPKDFECNHYVKCLEKQLKAKEQECEELKKGLNLILTVQKNCKECPHQKLDVDVLVCDLDCATAFKKIAKQTLKKLENKNV